MILEDFLDIFRFLLYNHTIHQKSKESIKWQLKKVWI